MTKRGVAGGWPIWVKLIIASVTYFIASTFLLGLLSILHGDCVSGFGDIDACIKEKQRLGWASMALVALLYPAFIFIIRRNLKRPP